MSVDRFESLEVWQKARKMVPWLYALTAHGGLSKDFALRDQMRRAAISVLSNIAEGFERGGNREFAQFLYIAKGSAGELRAQVYVAADLNYIDDKACGEILRRLEQISRMLSGLISYLRRSEMKGERFRVEDSETKADFDPYNL